MERNERQGHDQMKSSHMGMAYDSSIAFMASRNKGAEEKWQWLLEWRL